MTTRIELDFRHALAEPQITHEAGGPRLSLTHGEESVIVLLSESNLSALWLATTLALAGPDA